MPNGLGELKDITTAGATSLTTFNTAVGQSSGVLNACTQGAAPGQRVGRTIKMKSIYLRYFCAIAPTTTGGSPVRVVLVYDKQANTAAATPANLLVADNVYSPNDLSSARRFVTLMDRVVNVGVGQPSASIEFYKKCNLETQYNAVNGGTVADIQSGSLFMFVWASAGIQTASLVGGWTVRVRFED